MFGNCTIGHNTVEGIVDAAAVAVHLGIDDTSIVGGSGLRIL